MMKKKKAVRKAEGRFWWLLGIGGAITAVIITVVVIVSRPDKEVSGPRAYSAATVAFARQPFDPDFWYIEREGLDRELRARRIFEKKIQNCLNSFESKGVAELRGAFSGKLFITTFLPLGSGGASRAVGQEELQVDPAGKLEVTLYGKNSLGHPRLVTAFFYDHDWHAVFMPAIEMVEPWFCAYSLHELNHARNEKVLGLASAKAAFPTDDWFAEEVAAHEIETAVLNDWSEGRYRALLAKIAQEKSKGSLDEFLSNIFLEDLNAVNSLFPAATVTDARMRVAKFVLDLATQWTETRSNSIEEKIKVHKKILGVP